MSSNDYPVIVSIDFGTTFSGCSYAIKKDKEIYDITKWPKYKGFYAKVPSLVYYKNKNAKLMDWGNGARLLSLRPDQDGTLFQYFKLALQDPEITLPANKSPVTVISDYLRLFHEYICDEIQNAKKMVDYTPAQFCYCMTVPAIWTDKAKAMMREAAIKAGIIDGHDPLERLVFVAEPEAAAAYCENKYNAWNLSHECRFMIVDAGGGTIDLITYMVEDNEDAVQKRTLKEVAQGHGGMCGSAFIDQNMRNLIKSRLQSFADDMPTCMFEMIMDTFIERIKPSYHDDEEQYELEIPIAAAQYIPVHFLDDESRLVFEASELREKVFQPVLHSVVQLIQHQLDQVNEYVDVIFLVGGFGCSSYLYTQIKEAMALDKRVGEITMPPRGELSVVQGAIYHILRPELVSSKLLRHTYGLESALPFEEGIDPESNRIDGVRCKKRFDVIVRKGDRIYINRPIRRTFWVEYPHHTQADLYSSDSDLIPRYVTQPDVNKITEFPIKMPILADRMPGARMDVTVEFVFASAEIKMVVLLAGIKTEHVVSLE